MNALVSSITLIKGEENDANLPYLDGLITKKSSGNTDNLLKRLMAIDRPPKNDHPIGNDMATEGYDSEESNQ